MTSHTYALASNLIGFSTTALRVRVLETIGADDTLVITADLVDAGTKLLLSNGQLAPMPEALATLRHRDGLVTLDA